MHDLIFRFLLDSGFPRGSILADHNLGNSENTYHPAFLIVDPDSAETLALIDVVETGAVDKLSSHALHAARYAATAGRHSLQSFVIQVDSSNTVESDQVRFYQLLPGKKMQQISSYAFPDLEALRVARKLKSRDLHQQAVALEEGTAAETQADRGTQFLYFLAFLLTFICVLDWTLVKTSGQGIFNLQQILLLISAAIMLAIPIVAKQLRC